MNKIVAKELKVMSCPVCGRLPILKAYGVNYARMECKPWYRRKAHLSVFVGYHQPSQLLGKAVEAWNESADCARLPVG